jgi:hypothetical protein
MTAMSSSSPSSSHGTAAAAGGPASGPRSSASPRRRRTLRFGGGPEWSFAQVGAAATATASVIAYLGALHLAVGGFDGVWWLLVLAPVVLMRWSGSVGPLVLWGVLLIGWFVLTPEGAYSWWALPAAAAVVAAHAAHALSASSPPAGSFTRATLRRWLRHCLVALGVACVVMGAVAALSGHGLGVGGVGLVVGLAGVVAGLLWVRTSPPSSAD